MGSITSLLLALLRQSENQSRCTQISDLPGVHIRNCPEFCVCLQSSAINKEMGHLELSIRSPGLQQRPSMFSHDSETSVSSRLQRKLSQRK